MYSGITVGCVTIIGNKHISRQVPCEDASFAMQKNGVSVVCIADGAGGKIRLKAGETHKAQLKGGLDLLRLSQLFAEGVKRIETQL